MRILICSNVHWWNAEAAYAAAVASALEQAGHEVWVLTRPESLNEQKLRESQLRVVTDIDLNVLRPLELVRSYFRLTRWLRKQRIELVNAHRSEGVPLLVLAKWRLKSFRLVRTRGTTRSIRGHWLDQKLHCEWTDATIAAGEVVAARLRQAVPIPEERLRVIYYPTALPEWPLPEISRDYRNEFRILPDHRVLAIVGRIRREKGHRLLLRAFALVLQELPKLTLLILYRDTNPEEPEMRAVQSEVQYLKLQEHVRFDAEREDIQALMQFADAGVVSSIDSEVICRVAVEFFSVGTPVVAVPTGCLPEIIRDGRNGMLAWGDSPEALAEAMLRLLREDGLRRQCGDGARHDAEQRFNSARLLRETLEVYEQALSPVPPDP